MPDPQKSNDAPSSPAEKPREAEPVTCDRCGSPRVYRMHAVWRCADCGFKSDCCGW